MPSLIELINKTHAAVSSYKLSGNRSDINAKLAIIKSDYWELTIPEREKFLDYIHNATINAETQTNGIMGGIIGAIATPIASTYLCNLNPVGTIATAACGLFAGFGIGTSIGTEVGTNQAVEKARQNYAYTLIEDGVAPADETKFSVILTEATLKKQESILQNRIRHQEGAGLRQRRI